MDLIRRISKLFHEQAEEAHGIVIITKNTSKDEIEKFEKEIKKEKIDNDVPEKTKSTSRKPPDQI